jgi:hypothetical protein
MNAEAVECGVCGAQADNAQAIQVTVSGEHNQVSLHLCRACASGASATQPSLTDALRGIIVAGLKKLAGM